MKAFLMYKDRDFAAGAQSPPNAADLTKDLELDTLFRAMAGGDEFLLDAAAKTVFSSLQDLESILYRQDALNDCLRNPALIKQMYAIAVEAIERERKVWGWSGELPQSTIYRAVEVLGIFTVLLKKLRSMADEHALRFESAAFRRLFEMLAAELNDEYLARVEDHLRRLEFRAGVLLSAGLGKGFRGVDYILRILPQPKRGFLERVQNWLGLAGRDPLVYHLAERDEAGHQALSEIKSKGIEHVATALTQSTDHILSFFGLLRLELAFYIGCLNLHERMIAKGEPLSFPAPALAGETAFECQGIYDICMSLTMEGRAIGNDANGAGKSLIMITGANRGGKSTFLRAAGIAQLMMQCGMFAPAHAFRANLCQGLFTHFKREEDAGMKSGKLDEELSRMSGIIDRISPGGMALLNESFASTNEREGSEIARQIVKALLDSGVKVFYVTHMFDLARGFYELRRAEALFLRAERLPDGRRTFRILEGEPLRTSFGEDLYRRIFNDAPDNTPRESGETDAYALPHSPSLHGKAIARSPATRARPRE
jgi:DNA mismatch repair ATPase MutS